MSNADRTETQWGIRFPNGSLNGVWGDRTRVMQEVKIANRSLAVAGSTERAVVVTRTRTVTYTEWTDDE